MPPASAANQWNLLNYGTGHVSSERIGTVLQYTRPPASRRNLLQSVTVTVFTPGQQNPAISTGTGNVINKGLTSDAVGGVSICGHDVPCLL